MSGNKRSTSERFINLWLHVKMCEHSSLNNQHISQSMYHVKKEAIYKHDPETSPASLGQSSSKMIAIKLAIKLKMSWDYPWNGEMSQFKHLICSLCSIESKVWVYKIFRSLHSVFIFILPSVPTFLELGFYEKHPSLFFF